MYPPDLHRVNMNYDGSNGTGGYLTEPGPQAKVGHVRMYDAVYLRRPVNARFVSLVNSSGSLICATSNISSG